MGQGGYRNTASACEPAKRDRVAPCGRMRLCQRTQGLLPDNQLPWAPWPLRRSVHRCNPRHGNAGSARPPQAAPAPRPASDAHGWPRWHRSHVQHRGCCGWRSYRNAYKAPRSAWSDLLRHHDPDCGTPLTGCHCGARTAHLRAPTRHSATPRPVPRSSRRRAPDGRARLTA